jgi:hypothetical protein
LAVRIGNPPDIGKLLSDKLSIRRNRPHMLANRPQLSPRGIIAKCLNERRCGDEEALAADGNGGSLRTVQRDWTFARAWLEDATGTR